MKKKTEVPDTMFSKPQTVFSIVRSNGYYAVVRLEIDESGRVVTLEQGEDQPLDIAFSLLRRKQLINWGIM